MEGDFTDLLDTFQHKKNIHYKSHGRHNCKTCDISFSSREKLFDHLSTHIECEHDGCGFIGSAQTMTKHRKEEHPTVALQVFAMDNPEVLAAWLEQRRKNFPHSGNIVLKQQREEARQKRGLSAVDKTYIFKQNKWAVKRPCVRDKVKQKKVPEKEEADPLSIILSSKPQKKPQNKPHKSSALGLGAYDSSSDSEGDDTQVTSVQQTHFSTELSEKKTKPEEVAKQLKKFKTYAKILAADGKQKPKNKRVWNGVMKSGRRRFQPTLLQRLLSKDIKSEHNIVLQCIRYLADQNMLQPSDTK